MRNYDTEYTAKSLEKVAKRLSEMSVSVTKAAEAIRANGNYDEVSIIMNDLLWMLPNLGIHNIYNHIVREFELKLIECKKTNDKADD